MKILLLVVALLIRDALGAEADSRLAIVPAKTIDRVIAGKIKTASSIYAREFNVAGKYQDGSPAFGSVLVLFDPASSRFVWVYRRFANAGQSLVMAEALVRNQAANVYFGPDQIVFFNLDFDGLYSVRSTGTAASLDDAVMMVLSRASDELPAISHAENQGLFGAIKTELPAGWKGWFLPQGKSQPSGGIVTSVTKGAAGWVIAIERQWKGTIELDEDFKVMSVSRVP